MFALFDSVTKMLDQLDAMMDSFRALDTTVQQPSVFADYKDLDYVNKLSFLAENESALASLREMI